MEIDLPNGAKQGIHIDRMLNFLAFKTPRSDSCRSHMERVFTKLGVPKHWWVKYMMEIPHTLVFGLIMYSMVCKTTRYVQYSKAVASIDTKVIKVLIMGQQWKMSLSTIVALMTCFLASRDHEVLVVSDYIDTVFINAPCDFRFKLRVLCDTQYDDTVFGNRF